MKPLVFDLFCGLGGWSEAFIAEGYRAVGFDIEAHDYGNGGYPGELVLKDIRSLNGSELVKTYGVPACIVASPPCQEFSYMAMPWSKAKEKMRKILADASEQKRLTDLFNQCFRIQREVSEAAGHYVPVVVENVRGAEKWVGRARWKFGSFYLWGDVPALMPIPMRFSKGRSNFHVHEQTGLPSPAFNGAPHEVNILRHEAGVKAGDRNKGAANGEHKWSHSFADTLKGEGHKTAGMKVASETGRRTDKGKGAQFTSRDCGVEGNKNFKDFHDSPIAALGSKSKARKQASAEIARIPPALAAWIARTFKPKTLTQPGA